MNALRSGTWLAAAIAALTQPVTAAVSTPTNALVSTVSASHQFVACASDRLLPSALCAYAERVKREWLRRMDVADNWRDPVVLLVQNRQPGQSDAPPVSMAVLQTDEHLEYRIRCLVPPPIDREELLPTMVDALCSEWASREQATVPGKPYIVPDIPLWLVEGLAASIAGRYEPLLSVSKRSVTGGSSQQARDLLEAKTLPAGSADGQLFQANAWIFTEGLLGLHNGSRKMRSFLSELGAQKVASNAFWKVYHGDFPNTTALEKWWSLELVGRAAMSVAQNLSVEETERDLDAILVTRLGPTNGRRGMPGETDVAIADLWRYAGVPWLRDLLKLKIDRIGALRGVAHPLYLAVLDEYMEALAWLQRGSVTRFHRALSRAQAAQAVADKRSHGITAYLDQAERIYAPEPISNAFRGYFQTFDQLEKLERERHSSISDYLDKFDH
ncbi:MAG: hypothetical protein ABSG14_07640 [Verrucomicrobiia bacterium]|jgi:hypothetical protein